jgi:hypothetical protein
MSQVDQKAARSGIRSKSIPMLGPQARTGSISSPISGNPSIAATPSACTLAQASSRSPGTPSTSARTDPSFALTRRSKLMPRSALGLVSRVSPVHTAVRNCTGDEGGPFEVGNQVLISSHRKLLWSKATVVNVAETPGQDSGRQG